MPILKTLQSIRPIRAGRLCPFTFCPIDLNPALKYFLQHFWWKICVIKLKTTTSKVKVRTNQSPIQRTTQQGRSVTHIEYTPSLLTFTAKTLKVDWSYWL